MNARKISFLSVLIALAVVGRFTFTFIPNVQPMTSVIIITAMLLGPLSGVIVAAMSAVLSNLLLGMGYWTISQVICWSLIGLIAGLLGKWKIKKIFIVATVFSVLSGYLYGFSISLPMFIMTDYGWTYYLAGLPFDTVHAIGNGVFFVILYPILNKVFSAYLKTGL